MNEAKDDKVVTFLNSGNMHLTTINCTPVKPPAFLKAGVTYEVTIRAGVEAIHPEDIREVSSVDGGPTTKEGE